MPRTDHDPLGDRFKWRLRAELNRVRPRYSTPRYLSPARRRVGTWRFAPAGLAAGVAGMLALTAYAATGSANPVVWTERIVTTIEPNVAPEAGPTPSSEPSPHAAAPAPPTQHSQGTPRAEPSERPEGTPQPEPSESPQPGFGGGGEFQSNPSPSPSPWPGDR